MPMPMPTITRSLPCRAPATPIAPLRLLSVLALGYAAATAMFLASLGQDPVVVLAGMVDAFPTLVSVAGTLVSPLRAAFAVAFLLALPRTRRLIRQRGAETAMAVAYASLTVIIFGFVKNNLSQLVPFWADPVFADLDLALHFGHEPRQLLGWLDAFTTNQLYFIYMNCWLLPAILLPAILALCDADAARRRAFTLLWFAGWVGLGNVLALPLMSAGPIFYDMLPVADPDRFADVTAFVARDESFFLAMVRDNLWQAHASGQTTVGSGISAMPSVHVGMATVVALYVHERLSDCARALRLPSPLRSLTWALPLGIVATYQVLSVWLGWHYAVDGYLSILVICALARWMRRGPWRR